MERRDFLRLGACAAMAASRSKRLFAQGSANPVTLRVGKSTDVTMAQDLTGLSYESAQLAHAEFFSADNKALVAMFARLGNHSVLRLGGNTSEFTHWSPRGSGITIEVPAYTAVLLELGK